MALTDIQIRQAKAEARPYKLFDGGGLHLAVMPTGGKLWRLKYRVAGKEKLLALGAYPAISLATARKQADAARETIAAGGDPALDKRRDKARAKQGADDTFAAIAAEYVARRKRDGVKGYAPATAAKADWFISLLAPTLGPMPVATIEPADILAALRKLERRGNLESARRCLQFVGQVMRFAVATARLASDPSRDLKGALTAPRVKHHAAILEPVRLGALLRSIDGYEGDAMTRLALQLAPHVFVRPGELRQARWDEFDLEEAIWIIPAEKTKMRRPHALPLSRQALAILAVLHGITGADGGFLFPSLRSRARPMSDNTLNAALRRLGYSGEEMTAHGFRATASTLLNESGKWHPDAIERALAHGHSDAVRGAYARGQHWDERVKMAQWWSDYLDQLREGGAVLPFRTKGARPSAKAPSAKART